MITPIRGSFSRGSIPMKSNAHSRSGRSAWSVPYRALRNLQPQWIPPLGWTGPGASSTDQHQRRTSPQWSRSWMDGRRLLGLKPTRDLDFYLTRFKIWPLWVLVVDWFKVVWKFVVFVGLVPFLLYKFWKVGSFITNAVVYIRVHNIIIYQVIILLVHHHVLAGLSRWMFYFGKSVCQTNK